MPMGEPTEFKYINQIMVDCAVTHVDTTQSDTACHRGKAGWSLFPCLDRVLLWESEGGSKLNGH